MHSKSLILLVVALGCGVVASIGITKVMANRSAPARTEKVETVAVFVVKEDIPLGTMLTAENLKLEQWPKDKAPEGTLGELKDIEGRRPKNKLFAGEPVLDIKLLSKGESSGGASPQIPIGYRSVPVSVDDVSGGASMILPGDRVDVLVYAKQGRDIRTTMTKTILQDIRVFAVGSNWTLEADESGQSIRAKTISLLLTPEQTERVMLAHELGKLRLALRSPNDHEEAELPEAGHKIAQVFGDSEIADIERDSTLMNPQSPQLPDLNAMRAMMPTGPQLPSHTVRVISGPKVQDVVMQGAPEGGASSSPLQNGAGNTGNSATSLFWKIMSAPATSTNNQSNPPTTQNQPQQPAVQAQEPAKDGGVDSDSRLGVETAPDFARVDQDDN